MKEVIFTGCSEDQKRWGSHTGDTSKLIVGNTYKIEKEEVHSWHTKVFLVGFEGSFNSVCFEEAQQLLQPDNEQFHLLTTNIYSWYTEIRGYDDSA